MDVLAKGKRIRMSPVEELVLVLAGSWPGSSANLH